MTLVFDAPDNCELLTPAAAVAVCKVLEKRGIHPKIKWVNDLFLDGHKVCGILSERFVVGEKNIVSIGIGINLTTSFFPNELKIAGSINLECDKKILAEEIANALLCEIKEKSIVSEYKKRLFIIGKNIIFSKNNIEYYAKAVDINGNCNLIAELPDGRLETLSSGEISIRI